MFVVAGIDSEHQHNDQGSLDFYPSPSQFLDFNEEDREEIPWHVAGYGDHQVADSIPLQHVVLVGSLGDPKLRKNHRLIQVDPVERHIQQEPA